VKAALKKGKEKADSLKSEINALNDLEIDDDEDTRRHSELSEELGKFRPFIIASEFPREFNGNSFYKNIASELFRPGQLDSEKQASETLLSLGIRGIRYLDGSSRSAGEGSSNYVLFNDADVSITAKFSRPRNGVYAEASFRVEIDNNPSPEVASDVEFLRERIEATGRASGIPTESAALSPAKVPDAARGIVAVVKRLFNVDVRFVRAEGFDPRLAFNGIYVGKNVVYVNGDSTDPFSQIIGHEFLHYLKHAAPELYQQFVDALPRLVRLGLMNKAAATESSHYTDTVKNAEERKELGFEEVHADFFGDAWSDPKFWEALAATNLSVTQKALKSIQRFIGRIRALLMGERSSLLRTPLYRNFDAVRDLVMDTSIQFAEGGYTPYSGLATTRFMTATHGSLKSLQSAQTPGVIDFSVAPKFRHLFYGSPSTEQVNEFSCWLKENPTAFVRLYHGSAALNPILAEGIKKTTARRRNSPQSSSGYVYLSVYPGMSETFSEFASANRGKTEDGHSKAIYSVDLRVEELLHDSDQLRNQRLFAERNVGNTLAESLVYGHGARVKGDISVNRISGVAKFSRGKQGVRPLASEMKLAEDQSDAQALNDALVENFKNEGWRNAYQAVSVHNDDAEAARLLGVAFKKRIVTVAPTGAEFADLAEGFRANSRPDLLFVTVPSRNIVALAGHELYHDLDDKNPELHQWMLGNLAKCVQNFDRYTEKLNRNLRASEHYDNCASAEELLADFTGDALADPAFLQKLADDNPGKFKSLLTAVKQWLNKVISRLRGMGQRNSSAT
jgi:hypothetical protein